jgi:putative SOS response-associated peptidase YedK
VPMRWGLIPSWTKDPKIGAKMINARAETIAEKPAFRKAFAKRRCLIPMSGFYEWKQTPRGKVPHYVRLWEARQLSSAQLAIDSGKRGVGQHGVLVCRARVILTASLVSSPGRWTDRRSTRIAN